MTERLVHRYCLTFCQKLCDCQMETIRKVEMAFRVVTVEAFHVTKIKEATLNAQQRQSDADCLL